MVSEAARRRFRQNFRAAAWTRLHNVRAYRNALTADIVARRREQAIAALAERRANERARRMARGYIRMDDEETRLYNLLNPSSQRQFTEYLGEEDITPLQRRELRTNASHTYHRNLFRSPTNREIYREPLDPDNPWESIDNAAFVRRHL